LARTCLIESLIALLKWSGIVILVFKSFYIIGRFCLKFKYLPKFHDVVANLEFQ